ncbi:hypothetical protein G7054_g4189 [Neopestalotiopsis clavispora]|nr:hypothetical protein G7054_g4189 [Neopestalotiopsis clavispora]
MGVNLALLEGCWHEAERADRVAGSLDILRQHIPPDMRALLLDLITQIIFTSHNLRDITDHSQVHMTRVPWVNDYLNVLLPCLARTLQDIEGYYSNPDESRSRRWRRMYNEMSEELHGTSLLSRFVLYNDYLNQLRFMLGRSPHFDPHSLIHLQRRILDLRRARDILSVIQRSHWAESILRREPPTKTSLEGFGSTPSAAFGPWERFGEPVVSPDSKILASCLKFECFEKLVLFYNMFICLKLRSPQMIDFHPNELIMRNELNTFTAFVEEDDRTLYTLTIHRDAETRRRRLQMTLCDDGIFSGCPIWTAFLPRSSEVPRNKLLQRGKSDHIILIKNLQPYVFCDGYSVPATKSDANTYKIYFVNPIEARKFLTHF